MATLTPELQHLLRQCGGAPLRLMDPVTNREYVLLEAETYQRLQSLLETDDPHELYPLLHRAMQAEGWDDPQMEEYNQYG